MATINLIGKHGKYQFDPANRKNFVGEGGMGRVFRGKQEETGREVAIKVLFREFTNNPKNIERFKIESTVKIKHQNLIEMIDFVEKDGIYHIISEFLEGMDLSEKLKKLNGKGESFTPQQAREILLQVTAGIEELHKNKIIHRDIKPSNIMLLKEGGVKLFDYGIIKKNNDLREKLTKAGSFIGSYQYAAPEQIRNLGTHQINESTDVYALGITLYELLTGTVPFDGSTEFEIMEKQTKERIPPHAKIPKNYYNFIRNATSKDQSKRYATAQQFREALEKLPHRKIKVAGDRKKKRRIRIGLAIGAFAVLLGVTTGVIKHTEDKAFKEDMFALYSSRGAQSLKNGDYTGALRNYNTAEYYFKTDSIGGKISLLYDLSAGVEAYYKSDYKAAFEHLEKAADKGSNEAHYFLGEFYFNGYGIPKNFETGNAHLEKALAADVKLALYRVGLNYLYGLGKPEDFHQAQVYFKKSVQPQIELSQNKNLEATLNLGIMQALGQGVAKKEVEAYAYYKVAAEGGYVLAKYFMAQQLFDGKGVPENKTEALKWLSEAANEGNPYAQSDLGIRNFKGIGMVKNRFEGLKWLEKAAEQNHPQALSWLGLAYYWGELVPKDEGKAFTYLKKAAEFDRYDLQGLENLGDMYFEGIGTGKDYVQAVDLYRLAIWRGSRNRRSFDNLATMYAMGGYGLDKNESLAQFYRIRAKNVAVQ